MSDREDIELEALQRKLDDAFETTRPRRGFEDELWLRIQTRRPLWTRIQDGLSGLFQAIREAPAVPAAAIATLVVVAVAVGIFRSGFGGGGSGGSTAALTQGAPAYGNQPVPYRPQTAFGLLPGPAIPKLAGPQTPTAPSDVYAGAVSLTWTGQLNLGVTSAPVFRYFEPSAAAGDQFATSLGASLVSQPAGFIGSYAGTNVQVLIRGSVESPPSEPFFYLTPNPSAPPNSGAAPADAAASYLAAQSIVPEWLYTVANDTSGGVTRVRYLRQFDVPSYGPAYLVDGSGQRYGIEVDVKGGRVTGASGPLPLGLDSASYPIISAEQAVSMALATQTAQLGAANAPAVQLDKAELVYVLVVAGDHSFYEPAILFSGTFSAGGHTYTKHVLVPAVSPSLRTS